MFERAWKADPSEIDLISNADWLSDMNDESDTLETARWADRLSEEVLDAMSTEEYFEFLGSPADENVAGQRQQPRPAVHNGGYQNEHDDT